MEINKLIKFLEENNFKKNAEPETNLEKFSKMLDKLEGKPDANVIYTKEFEGDCCGAVLTIEIYPSKNNINASFFGSYPNFVWEEDQEIYKDINSSDEYEIINFAKQFVGKKFEDEIITDEMMNTILFCHGERRSEEYLEDDRMSYLDNYSNNNNFLKDCGFNSMEEYYQYLEKLK